MVFRTFDLASISKLFSHTLSGSYCCFEISFLFLMITFLTKDCNYYFKQLILPLISDWTLSMTQLFFIYLTIPVSALRFNCSVGGIETYKLELAFGRSGGFLFSSLTMLIFLGFPSIVASYLLILSSFASSENLIFESEILSPSFSGV